jgi:acetoacetate decarboxylase
MLYALTRSELRTLRAANRGRLPIFTGAEMLIASYRTKPSRIADILPRPLAPAREPVVVAFVARYPETNFGPGYREGALFVQATHRGKLGLYCLSMPVTDDMAMAAGREILGFPKKMADRISLDTVGSRKIGSVVRKGVEILRIEADPKEDAKLGDLAVFGSEGTDADGQPRCDVTSYLFKFPPSPNYRSFSALPRLIRQVTVFRPRSGLQTGWGRVDVKSSPFDPLGEVSVEEGPVSCVYGTFDNTMLEGHVVGRVWNVLSFVPHAFFGTDIVAALIGHAPGPDWHAPEASARARAEARV